MLFFTFSGYGLRFSSALEGSVFPKASVEARAIASEEFAALLLIPLIRRDGVWDVVIHLDRLQVLGIGAHPLEFSLLRLLSLIKRES